MKKLFIFGLVALLGVLTSCLGGSRGELVGVLGRQVWYQPDPYGMLYIPAGSYNMGASDQDVPWAHTNRSKTVSIQAFYMDQTEISNNEYRQFVYYVRDSIAHVDMYDNGGISEFMIEEDMYGDPISFPWGDNQVNWNMPICWDCEDERLTLEWMFLDASSRFYFRKEIDTRILIFEYYWIDLKEAARKGNIDPNDRSQLRTPYGKDKDLGWENSKGQNNAIRGHANRSQFIIKERIPVYPDTLCWVHDFTYSYNEPMTNMYFWHPAYDDYPVVGVTWFQAKAFCVWRTQLLNSWLHNHNETFVQDFRLPTEAEWEYAARGGLDLSPYPWGGPYIRNSHGCFLGNFKPMRGRYMEDGGFHTVKIFSYHPNDYGLYNMAGNVSEWTSTAYDESVYEFAHDLNTEYSYDALDKDPPSLKRKVVRGGSWKDIGYYLQTGTRTYEYQDTAKSYVGYRCVMTYLGRAKGDEQL